jgi:hypothetical protein
LGGILSFLASLTSSLVLTFNLIVVMPFLADLSIKDQNLLCRFQIHLTSVWIENSNVILRICVTEWRETWKSLADLCERRGVCRATATHKGQMPLHSLANSEGHSSR